jgi:hypothetical protein
MKNGAITAIEDQSDGSARIHAPKMMTYFQILLWEKWLEDYNPDGSIKTTGITYEQFRYHTIFFDLDQEEAVWDF